MKKTTTKPSPRVAALEKKPNASSEMMTVLQVAEYLVVNPETIYLLLKNRRIPGFKVSSGWRFRRSDIDQWISDRQIAFDTAVWPTSMLPSGCARQSLGKEDGMT